MTCGLTLSLGANGNKIPIDFAFSTDWLVIKNDTRRYRVNIKWSHVLLAGKIIWAAGDFSEKELKLSQNVIFFADLTNWQFFFKLFHYDIADP